jgi:streptogramin lyase
MGVTVDTNGNVWFVEYLGNNIGEMTSSGAITEYPIPSAIANPVGIAWGPDNNLWFTESSSGGGGKIGKMTPSGTATEIPVPTQGTALSGITAAGDGNMWFSEVNAGKIGRIVVASPTPVP